jgi:hypothetical protein
MLKFTVPVSTETNVHFSNARRDRFMLGTTAEFVEMLSAIPLEHARHHMTATPFQGGLGFIKSLEYARDGDMSQVAASDALLSKLDAIPAPTARHAIIDDVVGAFPNVPAFIAGQPLSMRRKIKRDNEFMPLAVVVNLSASAGVSADKIKLRGAAILALVRAISARRPVELWAGATFGNGNPAESCSCYFRIDTTPLDLARSAHLLSHPSILRALLFSTWYAHYNQNPFDSIPWQYNGTSNLAGLRATYPQIIARGFPQVSEVLAIHALHLSDPVLVDPVKWIKDNVTQYAGGELKEAA